MGPQVALQRRRSNASAALLEPRQVMWTLVWCLQADSPVVSVGLEAPFWMGWRVSKAMQKDRRKSEIEQFTEQKTPKGHTDSGSRMALLRSTRQCRRLPLFRRKSRKWAKKEQRRSMAGQTCSPSCCHRWMSQVSHGIIP